MAHVEAPTRGSIILAGILLTLGGCGLVRFSQVVPVFSLRSSLRFYIMLRVVLVSLISLCQSDFKRLVAYSSVVHMRVLVLAVLRGTGISYRAVLMVIVFHGFTSPMIFLLVGIFYSYSYTRLLSIVRGFLLVSPLLSLFALIRFLGNIPTPPFSRFISEVLLFVGFRFISLLCYIFIFSHVFLSILFNSY